MNEIILLCGCHKVTEQGEVYSLMEQYSQKGVQGIQTYIHRKTIRVNRLIAQTFIPNPNNYPDVLHVDGSRDNNNVSNLVWGTAVMNAADRERHGRTAHGSQKPMSKLTEADIPKIWEHLNAGVSLKKTAEAFKVSKKLILLIKQKKIWTHVNK